MGYKYLPGEKYLTLSTVVAIVLLMPNHTRPVLPEELDVLKLATTGTIGMAPVLFNGKEYYALVSLSQRPDGLAVTVLGIVPLATDEVLDAAGRASWSEAETKPSILN